MTRELQDRFDKLLEDAIDSLPEQFAQVIEELPVIVVDRPDKKLIEELRRDGVLPPPEEGDDPDDELMGLHTGVAITEGTLGSSGHLPGHIHIFREPVVSLAGGWEPVDADEQIYEEIRVTLLHEIGHHFGLDEDDLEDLGYA